MVGRRVPPALIALVGLLVIQYDCSSFICIFQSIVALGSSLDMSHPSYSTDSMGAAREMSSGIVSDAIPENSVLGMGMEKPVGLMCAMNAFPLESLMVI